MQVAVISDLHANPTALKAALIQAQPYDRLICLGDLLSYGVQIEETLDLLEESGAELILGNHDLLYLEMIDGNKEYYDSLPKWMQDMADFTYKKLDHQRFKQLVFKKEIIVGNKVYLSHANPWGDW